MKILVLLSFLQLTTLPVYANDFLQGLYSELIHKHKKHSHHKKHKKHHHSSKEHRYSSSKDQLDTIFDDLTRKFQYAQDTCTSRQNCLREEKKILVNKSQSLGKNHPVYKNLQDLLSLMDNQSQRDFYVTQLYLFKSMTPEAQEDYESGLRISSLDQHPPKTTRRSYDNRPSIHHYVLDDILNIAIQKIEKNHKQCSSRNRCLESDKALLSQLAQQLDYRDPALRALSKIIKNIDQQADRQIFDGISLIKMYRDKGVQKTSQAMVKSKDAQRWIDIKKSASHQFFKKARTTGYTVNDQRYSRHSGYYSSYDEREQESYAPNFHYEKQSRHAQKQSQYYDDQSRYNQDKTKRYKNQPTHYQDQTSRHYNSDKKENIGENLVTSILSNLFRIR